MVFKCAKGMYQLQKNYRDAFKLEAFEEKYLEECFDKDMYIVGDISSEILRLKGFDTDPKSKNYFGFIDDYLDISCAFGCPYFVLKRVRSEEEFAKLERENKPVITEDDRVEIKPITTENFDKESLVLKTSPKGRPHIVIDSRKINAIPKGELPKDLKDDTKDIPRSNKVNTEPEKPVVVETFVSSSEDFDPSKKQSFRGNKNNRPKNQNQEKKNNGGGEKKPNPNQKPNPEKKPQEKKPNPNQASRNNSPKPEEKKPQENGGNPNGGGNNNHHHHHNNKNRNRNKNGAKPQSNKEGQ